MENQDIFDMVIPEGEFFKFTKIGDSIKGTYVGKKDIPPRLQFGAQIGYHIKDENGKAWIVAQGINKRIFHERMDEIFFGQIVGFKFDRIKPASTKGLNDTNIINIYASPECIDEKWLAAQQKLESFTSGQRKSTTAPSKEDNDVDEGPTPDKNMFNGKPFVVPSEAEPVGGNIPQTEEKPNEALNAIRNLASTKGLTTGMNDKMADESIEQYTGLPLTEENLTKIIISLTGYKA